MKVLAINGSPNKDGNTWHALNMVGEELKNNGIDFEILYIGNKHIHGCLGCKKCAEHKDEKCSIKKDDLNKWLQMAKAADGLLIGSPVYYSGIAGTLKSFLDRLFYVSGSNGNLFRHKVGAAVIAVRRSGGSSTLDALIHYFTVTEMLVPGSSYWNIIHGRTSGEVEQDLEGKQALRVLARNMAWLLKMKEATKDIITPPLQEKKETMSFIR